jgi:RNA polymerase sigma-70 factor, ECF subfamily
MTDARRFKELASPNVDAAYNLARWLLGNDSDAEDVVQDALLRAYRSFDGYRGGVARAWLFKIVRNVAYTALAKRRDERDVVQLHDLDCDTDPNMAVFELNPEILYGRSDAIRRINGALERLPLPYREVIVLRELEDCGYKDISMILDIPIGTVMSRLSRARRMLSAALSDLREPVPRR